MKSSNLLSRLAIPLALVASLIGCAKKSNNYRVVDLNRDGRPDIVLSQGMNGNKYPQVLIQKEDGAFELTNVISGGCGIPFYRGDSLTYSLWATIMSNYHLGGKEIPHQPVEAIRTLERF